MFKKKKTYVILVLILLIAGGIYYSVTKKPQTEYTTQSAQKGTLTQTVSVTGKLIALEQVDLSFKLSGRIEAMYVKIGDRVVAGQKIATIDRGTLNNQLQRANQEVIVQKETLANMKRHESLYGEKDKEVQRARISQAEADVSGLLKQIRETTLYAPISGMVITKNVEVGETTVANAVTANTSVVTVAKEGDLEIQANVPESDIEKIALGQKAEATLDAFSAQDVFAAEVSEIEPAATVIQDVVYYKVKLKFPAYDERFKNGMSVDADIHTAQKDNVVFIPERAIKNDADGKYVEILKDAKTDSTDKIYVQTGIRGDDGMIEITSGLTGGENVITLAKAA